jgi:hypothetical protein
MRCAPGQDGIGRPTAIAWQAREERIVPVTAVHHARDVDLLLKVRTYYYVKNNALVRALLHQPAGISPANMRSGIPRGGQSANSAAQSWLITRPSKPSTSAVTGNGDGSGNWRARTLDEPRSIHLTGHH